MRSRPRVVFAGVVVFAAAACEDSSSVLQPTTEPDGGVAAQVQPGRPERPQEAPFRGLAAAVPGYGGHFVDEDGNLVAYVKDMTRAAAARAALASVYGRVSFLQRARGRQVGSIVIRKADFGFEELSRWRDAVFDNAAVPGLLSIDVDEARNRLVIAIDRKRASEIRREIDGLLPVWGVPPGGARIARKTR